jgi:hypothetical protein
MLSMLLYGLTLLSPLSVSAQENGQARYKVGRNAVVSVTNSCGPITVKASGTNEVRVKYSSASKSVIFDHQKHGKRITLSASSDQPGTHWCEYIVLVPSKAFVTLFAGGEIHAEGLGGNIVLQTTNSPVEVKNMNNAHVHIRTIDGQSKLTSIHNSYVYVHSVNGSISISDAPDSSIEADSDAGTIAYQGDPGSDGEYRLATHSGDLDLSIPASALVRITTASQKVGSGQYAEDSAYVPVRPKNTLLKPGNISTPLFHLRSFTGRIRLKRP